MQQIISFLQQLSLAQILAAAGGFVLLFTLISLMRGGSKDSKDQNSDQSAGRYKNKNSGRNNSLSRKEPAWDQKGAVQQQSFSVTETDVSEQQPQKKKSFFSLFGSKDKNSPDNSTDESAVLQPAGQLFTHSRATDHFNETVKPGPASDLKSPDTDDLDRIFTVMLKAGAVTPKAALVTNYEHQYLEKLRIWFGYRYHIYCQVSVGSVLSINTEVSNLNLQQRRTFAQKCHNMSFDFMLVEKSTDSILCAIELDDPTHMQSSRMSRDRRLDKVCAAVGLPIFHITNIYQKPDLGRMKPMCMKIR